MNTVEKGVPIPAVKPKGRKPKYPFAEMEIEDSIYSEERAICVAALKYAERSGKKFVTRQVGHGYRVWRVE